MLQNNDRMGVMFDLFKKFPSWGVEDGVASKKI